MRCSRTPTGREEPDLLTTLPRPIAATLLAAEEWVRANLLIWATVEQIALVAVVLGLLMLLRPRLHAWTEAWARPLQPLAAQAVRATVAAAPWLIAALLLDAAAAALRSGGAPTPLLRLAVSLTLAWVVIRLISRLVRDPRISRTVAALAWLVAALNIARLLTPTLALLDAAAITAGGLRISLLLLLKAVAVLLVSIWLANLASRLLEQQVRRLPSITPAMQVLASKLIRAGLLTIAVVLALGTVGIDLTAFAVFSGAIGVGIGFGLQKVVSNLISGVILLLDASIKPGDVIELAGTYGWITQLNARYVSVVTRDGTEHLIPNEDLITQRVVNWTYSNERVRLHLTIGVAYRTDLHAAMRLTVEAAASVARVLPDPRPVCLLRGFGDSTVTLELRFWIEDPRAGTANVESDVLLAVWDRFQAAGVELPFPRMDVHVKEPVALARTGTFGGRSG